MKMLRTLALLLGFSGLMLAGCDGESQLFEEAVEIRNLQITTLNVTPPANSQPTIFLNTGDQVQFGIKGDTADGSDLVLSGTGRKWGVIDSAAAAGIDTNGLLTARADGVVSVFVQIGDLVSTPFTLEVLNSTLTAIEAIDGVVSIERCLPQNYLAIGTFVQGTPRNLSSVSWDIGEATNARVVTNPDGTATLTGTNAGALMLNATSGTITATAPASVTVQDTLSALDVSPSPAIVDVDESLAFTATGTYNDQPATEDAPAIGIRRVVISDSVDWEITSGTANASVSNVSPNKGTVTGVASGNAVLSANCGDLADLQTIVISSTESDDSDQLSFNTTDNPLIIARSNTAGFRLRVSTGSTFSVSDEVTDEVSWSLDPVGSTTASISLLETGTSVGLIRPNATGDTIVTATRDGQSINITVRVAVVIP